MASLTRQHEQDIANLRETCQKWENECEKRQQQVAEEAQGRVQADADVQGTSAQLRSMEAELEDTKRQYAAKCQELERQHATKIEEWAGKCQELERQHADKKEEWAGNLQALERQVSY